jgi:aerobic carbon-monoxide dehydrogenase large subunit
MEFDRKCEFGNLNMSQNKKAGASDSHIGRPHRRPEDIPILRGSGGFFADIESAGALEIYFVRSSEAHARIASIEIEAALQHPGVAAVLTGRDFSFAERRLPCIDMGSQGLDARQFLLPTERVRYVHPS